MAEGEGLPPFHYLFLSVRLSFYVADAIRLTINFHSSCCQRLPGADNIEKRSKAVKSSKNDDRHELSLRRINKIHGKPERAQFEWLVRRQTAAFLACRGQLC